MATSLVIGLTDLFKSQGLGPFAAQSGESEVSVLRGFEATVGTMVTGLASKLRQTGFARKIFDLVSSPANDPRVLDDVQNIVSAKPDRPSDAPGSRLLSMLFGGKQSAVSEAVSRASGLRSSSAASLMGLGAPLLLGWLGKRVREGGMDASQLSSLVSQEAAGVKGTLPSGVANLIDAESQEAHATVPPIATAVVREHSNRWLVPLLLALVLIAVLASWFMRRPRVATTTTATLVTRTLPNNLALQIPAGRMEDHLLVFIQDPSKPVDQTTWFDFDRLLFDTNSATLQPSSQEQLHNIAAILNAYPNVHVKIGGYTDNTGDARANERLSQQRADSVDQELIAMGIPANRLEAKGYGQEHPVADNSTEAGRQMNRRISLLVIEK